MYMASSWFKHNLGWCVMEIKKHQEHQQECKAINQCGFQVSLILPSLAQNMWREGVQWLWNTLKEGEKQYNFNMS